MSLKIKILLGILLLLLLMQFARIDKTNPPADASKDMITMMKPPAEMATMIKNTCYDCHSNHTQYPWYTNIAPLSWWIKNHINHGREHLNFSEWGNYSADKRQHKMEECYEWVEETRMPIFSYVVAHPEAKMTAEERAKMVKWFKAFSVEVK